MSRLLDSLQKAQLDRISNAADTATSEEKRKTRTPEPAYFWTSAFWLTLTCGLIVGGFLLLQHRLHGVALLDGLKGLLHGL
jgi:hypothetical protein